MGNIAKWLTEEEQKSGERIDSIVIGRHDKHTFEDVPFIAEENAVLSRDAGLHILDVEYDNGYGGADCFPIFAWSNSRVYFISEYDGSTGLSWVPRNPQACAPGFDGTQGADDGF